MFNIHDYIKYYKDTTIDEVNWNVMDNLICAILSYLPLNSFEMSISLEKLHSKCKMAKSKKNISSAEMALEILDLLVDCKRYKDLNISNFVNIKNDDTQFGALTFKIKDITIISYKGTDDSTIGWLENFRLSCEYPTNTQLLALEYLNKTLELLSKDDIYVVGHSKGGNLAMSSVMETLPANFDKIKKVYNFDGPGFRKNEFESLKFKKLSEKLVNIIPSGSVVGVLLYNKNYKTISSNTISIYDHYPTSWNIFGEFFIEDRLSALSMRLHKSTTTKIEKIDDKKLKNTIETIFNIIGKENKSRTKITLNDIKNICKNIKNIDPLVEEYIDDILYFMINISS